jgi:hypothetical protein
MWPSWRPKTSSNEKKVDTMKNLLARYFDGDLSDSEARQFLDAVESDPDLEMELRAYERVISLGKALPSPRVPERFTERVMRSVAADLPRQRVSMFPALFRLRWAGAAAAAAVVIIAFAGGVWMGRGRGGAAFVTQETRVGADATVMDTSSLSWSGATAAGSEARYVRLVYVPADRGTQGVSVAGSFNNWNPTVTPLRRQNGVWSTILVLPPGSYEYMFVEDGKRWVTDPLAVHTRDDGFGSANAVLDVEL